MGSQTPAGMSEKTFEAHLDPQLQRKMPGMVEHRASHKSSH